MEKLDFQGLSAMDSLAVSDESCTCCLLPATFPF